MQILDPNEFSTKRKPKIECYASLFMNKLIFSPQVSNLLLADANGKQQIKLGITETGEIVFKMEEGGFSFRLMTYHRGPGRVYITIYNKQLCAHLRDKYGFTEKDRTVMMLVSPEKDDNGFYTIIPRKIK